MLVERDINKSDLAKAANISSASIAKLGKGANITTDVLLRICEALDCDIADLVEVVRTDESQLSVTDTNCARS